MSSDRRDWSQRLKLARSLRLNGDRRVLLILDEPTSSVDAETEAAIMDGAGMWTVFWRIILPLSQPALATMATFHILASWSEYILALVLTGTTASRTLPVGISLLEGHFTSNEPGVAAGMVITIIPAVIAFAFPTRKAKRR